MDLRISCWLIFSLVTAFVNSYEYISAANKWTLCLVDSVHTTPRILSLCPKLAKSPIECVTETDRFACLRRVANGDVDVTVLEPEELVAIRNYKLYSVLVTNELRLFPDDDHRFQIVAIAHKNVQRIWDVKGKRLCHPGLDNTDDMTKIFSTYFENLIIKKECDANMTLFENRMHALSNYFETACIAGPWSADTVFDYQLKTKYRNLCAACERPASCYNSDKYYGREGALLCLTDGMGDVAWVRLGDARVHFKMIDVQDYKFLCPDGTTKPLNFKEPCVWISKPWPVIVAKPSNAENIAHIMNSMMNRTFSWESNVLQLMENYYITSTDVKELQTPDDYLHRYPNFLSANVRTGCQPSREIRWCLVSSLEKRKCSWLRDASVVYGVEPLISCLEEESREACVEAIRKGRMDIFLARPDELFENRMMGLKPIIHAMANSRQELNRIVAVVKRNSRFRVMKDLKGAKAAFTGYRSVGWNAFVTLMRNESDGNWDCSDAQAVSKFFKDSCVLGWNNKNNGNELPANLYSLCKEGAEHAGDDLSTFNYLASGVVDVAFVNLKIIENKTEAGDFYYEKIDTKYTNRLPKYRVLGPTLAEAIKRVPYLLAWTPLGSIMAHENITDLRRQEIYTMLLEMDKIFGRKFNGQAPTFLLYGPYEDNHGVIFPDGTRYLQLHGHQTLKGRSYDEIVEELVQQEACSTANAWMSDSEVLFLSIVIFVLSRLLHC
ncbi:PREDICTED: transferrin [Wasmannia auropunctata]|uniref:transferrin n=1 Tax=Wasmannia auropunctata TaxID=64793 RepID=UPI0005EFDB97|nr:PREDICTED: transferrin [Wasmannia auropunctata]XP_011704441.1 PREDICTED: transferrin [Wasmannia auropunctata]XP_011704442.1 PREDICTED: transferrin [Wasmannia auropunctata]XP_011704443.1 PREDICTED: transferrin [Wasmannia auropunctata]XP_011704444.1 PREDICTED: transferrin [Wasmannia auropunctata]XP_011704445.1 PREDICTED: transferrin [Wasmannia auropunctata]XP_011704446.1 PREDICTED: transferrin [Wasmannia auropunctata]XP_011704447.1 PREDICTED: transferrin [Wasmannia auropunctata]